MAGQRAAAEEAAGLAAAAAAPGALSVGIGSDDGGGGGDSSGGEGDAASAAPLSLCATPASAATSTGSQPLEIQRALLPKPGGGGGGYGGGGAGAGGAGAYVHPLGAWRRRYMVALVSAITALLCADQNLLAPNLSAAAEYFGLDDRAKDTYLGGYLQAAFFLVGAPAALVFGFLADRHNRVWLLAIVVIVGEAPCLATYWVTTLWQFFVLRVLTGLAVGGCFPLVFSLLGDLFPPTSRSAMAALVQIAVGAGIGGGQMLAGILGPATSWKMPFVVMAAPTLLLAVLLLLTAREPPRGGFEAALADQLAAGGVYSETISWRKVRRLLRIPSNWIIVFQGLPGCLPWGVMQTYINDFLHLNKGLSVQAATVVILLFGIGCAAGVLIGGSAGQLLYNWRKESMALLAGLSVLAGAAPVLFLINADLQAAGFGVALLMSALAGALVSVAGPNLRAIMLNVNTPETRGVALALQTVTDDLGRGLGPVIVAGFISRLGRQGAFNLAVGGWVPCGLLLCCLACTMRRDERQMQQQLLDKAAPAGGLQITVDGALAADAAALVGDGGGGGAWSGSPRRVRPLPLQREQEEEQQQQHKCLPPDVEALPPSFVHARSTEQLLPLGHGSSEDAGTADAPRLPGVPWARARHRTHRVRSRSNSGSSIGGGIALAEGQEPPLAPTGGAADAGGEPPGDLAGAGGSRVQLLPQQVPQQ